MISVYIPWEFPNYGVPVHSSSEIHATSLIQFAQTHAKFRGRSRDYLRTCPCFPEKLIPTSNPDSRPLLIRWAKKARPFGLGRAQAHSRGARIFLIGSTQSSGSANSRTTGLASAGLLCPRLENRPPRLTQAEAPPREWRQRQASPGMLRGRRQSNADERNFC